jgi:hypothetical protein
MQMTLTNALSMRIILNQGVNQSSSILTMKKNLLPNHQLLGLIQNSVEILKVVLERDRMGIDMKQNGS